MGTEQIQPNVQQPQTPPVSPLPGLDVVGRGLYLKPHGPYELKGVLFPQEGFTKFHSQETGCDYHVPCGYAVQDSPPTPKGLALNQIHIEESWERFSKQRRLDANLAAGVGSFSVNANLHVGQELRSDEEAFYGVRSSFVPLWSIYLENPRNSIEIDASNLPVPFQPAHRAAYSAFFEQYGTHFVKRAWVGGKADIMFSVSKSSEMSKQDIQAGLQASYGPVSGSVQGEQHEHRERLKQQSQCTVLGRGGDEYKLAALSSLDEVRYNEWIKTIRSNPQTIEIEVAGIWTLINDPERATAMMEAYRTAAIFQPISSVFCIDDIVYFTRGRTYFTYNTESGISQSPGSVTATWPELDDIGFDRIDAAFQYDGLMSPDGSQLGRKLYLFRRDQYVRIDLDTNKLDKGFPRLIRDDWRGIEFDKIDAVLATDAKSIFFFAGSEYTRFNGTTWQADPGYPELIQQRWRGVSFDRIDAAIYWGGGKIYFFRDDEHIRYDITTLRADPGYPKALIGNYVEDWKFFD